MTLKDRILFYIYIYEYIKKYGIDFNTKYLGSNANFKASKNLV